MTGPSSAPRGERAGTPGARWETELRAVEQVVDDDAPDPRPNRAARRAMSLDDRRRQALARLATRTARPQSGDRTDRPPKTLPSGIPRSDADWEAHLDRRDALIAQFLEPDLDEGDAE